MNVKDTLAMMLTTGVYAIYGSGWNTVVLARNLLEVPESGEWLSPFRAKYEYRPDFWKESTFDTCAFWELKVVDMENRGMALVFEVLFYDGDWQGNPDTRRCLWKWIMEEGTHDNFVHILSDAKLAQAVKNRVELDMEREVKAELEKEIAKRVDAYKRKAGVK
jgi:hypothetical protein